MPSSVLISRQRKDNLSQILSQSEHSFGYLIGRRLQALEAYEVLFFCQSSLIPSPQNLSSPDHERIKFEMIQLSVNFHSSSLNYPLSVIGLYFGSKQAQGNLIANMQNSANLEQIFQEFFSSSEVLAAISTNSELIFENFAIPSKEEGKFTRIMNISESAAFQDEKFVFFQTKCKFPMDLEMILKFSSENEKDSLTTLEMSKNSLFCTSFCTDNQVSQEIDETKLKNYIERKCMLLMNNETKKSEKPIKDVFKQCEISEKIKENIPKNKENLKDFVISLDKTNFIDLNSINLSNPIQISSFFGQDNENPEKIDEFVKIFSNTFAVKEIQFNFSIFMDVLIILETNSTIVTLSKIIVEKFAKQVQFAFQRLKTLFTEEKEQKPQSTHFLKALKQKQQKALYSFGFFHFRPNLEFQTFPFPLTIGYCFASESDSVFQQEIDNSYYLVKERENIASKFFLSGGVSSFCATTNALTFQNNDLHEETEDSPRIPKNPHLLVEWSPLMKLSSNSSDLEEKRNNILGNSKLHIGLVCGDYLYFHYLQDGFDDCGWGCSYRSCQTLISWLKFHLETVKSRISSFEQGFFTKTKEIQIPKHRDIQTMLVEEFKDKPPSFVGSRQWIGAFELSLIISSERFDHFESGDLRKVQGKILSVAIGSKEELLTTGTVRKLIHHFKSVGSPVMIGGGVLAFTLLGIVFDEKRGDIDWLILDPHYTGKDFNNNNSISEEIFEKKGNEKKAWCGWRKTELVFKKNSFYNFCLPSI